MPTTQDGPHFFPKPAFIRREIRADGPKELLPIKAIQFSDPSAPSADELRDGAVSGNYFALVDASRGKGFNTLFGPNAPTINWKHLSCPDGNPKTTRWTYPALGWEYVATAADFRTQDDIGQGNRPQYIVTLGVWIPDTFDITDPRILALPSSGSRGLYGASSAAEWGLRNGFAIAFTDKGTGAGIHFLDDDMVIQADGRVVPAATSPQDGEAFIALSGEERDDFVETKHFRCAYKQAHAQGNCEQAWGQYVIMSIEYALHIISSHFEKPIDPQKTLIIASSISNGGGSSLRAAEQAAPGLIKGVVVVEPNVTPVFDRTTLIQQGNGRPLVEHSRPLLDYTTLINIYQGCIAYDPKAEAIAAARRHAMTEKKLLRQGKPQDQENQARDILRQHGLLPEQEQIQKFCWEISIPQAVAVTYASAYSRIPVTSSALGFSFAYTDSHGYPAKANPQAMNAAYALSGGIVPDGATGAKLINDRVDPSREDRLSTADGNLEGALRLRSLFLGRDMATQTPLAAEDYQLHLRIKESIEAIRAGGNLHGIPTIIIHGRSDCIIAPNHTSRPYYALALKNGGAAADNVRYYEVTKGTHIDALIPLAGPKEYVPLHYYLFRGLDLMLAHLKDEKRLPPSQVVRAGWQDGIDELTLDNVDQIMPPIADIAAAPITFENGILRIPA